MNSDIDYRGIALQKSCYSTTNLPKYILSIKYVWGSRECQPQYTAIHHHYSKRACNVPTHIVMLLIINDSLFNCCIS